MNRETLIWTLLFVGGGILLAVQSGTKQGVGLQYVQPVEVAGRFDPDTKKIVPVVEGQAGDSAAVIRSIRYNSVDRENPKAIFSPARTIGIWIAALVTLCIFSYLYRDNVFYKFAESVIVGVSAGYTMVTSIWQVLIAKVLVKLAPDVARYAFLPDTPLDAKADYLYIVPVLLGGLLFCRLVPRISWLGRWPLAFVVGTTAGLKLVLFLDADFVQQIRSTILPMIVYSATQSSVIDWKQSLHNIVLIVSVLSSLTYFYFSVEHKGIIGRISRMGVWVLMISFGASFALTVMGRITLLTMRLQFLFEDWLGLVRN